MKTMEERFLIYTALLLLCATSAVFVGAVAALWSFVQIVAVIELVFLVGAPAGVRRLRGQ
jgi:hypothetical protein